LLRFSAWIGGDWWWALAGALLGAALVAALHGAPVLLARLADVRSLARTDLSAQLNALAARAQVPVTSVQEMLVDEGERATALVTGAGGSRRIFLASQLVRDWSDAEIAVVVAHELGHHAHRDLWRTLALDASILAVSLFVADRALGWMAAGLGLAGPRDLAALPLITLVAGFVWLLMTPLRHAHSRVLERRADEFALALTDGADAFASAIRRLGARHLSEDRPSVVTRWLFHRHPTPEQRLALAAAHRLVRRAD
jgi:STE24 endopeptidase